MSLIQLIYVSQPFGYDAAGLSNILLDARRCNARDGLTGALICRRDIYLQLLEGPEAAVDATYARIRRDDRHVDLRLILRQPVEARLFSGWDMLHDPAQTWIWDAAAVSDGAVDRAPPQEVLAVFETLAARVTAPPA